MKLLFLLFFQSIFAQNYRIIYQFDYKRDSTSTVLSHQNMVLEIRNHSTKFYYYHLLKLDSISKYKKIRFSFPLQQIVIRNSNSYDNENFVSIQDKYFKFSTSDRMEWKIKSDSIKVYLQYKLQKAETEWGGRKWIAWFCTEIPIDEGPYKFRGLPGLIIELYDTQQNFKYTLLSIEKKENEYDTHNIVETNLGIKPININLKQYQKLLLNEYNNPFAEYENMKGTNWGLTIFGKYINTMEGLQSIRREYQSDIRNNYNPVELNRAVKYYK